MPVCLATQHRVVRYRDIVWIWVHRDSSVGIATRRPGDRIPVRARISAPVQTGPETYLASYTMSSSSFPVVKQSWRGRVLRGLFECELYCILQIWRGFYQFCFASHWNTSTMYEALERLGCYAVYIGSCLPTFRESLLTPLSRVKAVILLRPLNLGTDGLSRKFCNQLPTQTTYRSKRGKAKTIPRWMPESLYLQYLYSWW
jgi:hypothetical protein